VTPEQMKVIVVLFAAVSLGSLTFALVGWLRPESVPSWVTEERSARRGTIIMVAVSLALLGGLWFLGTSFDLGRDRVLWVGFGVFLVLMTLTRPWWFWENYRARWLRNLIGDDATAAFYLILAGAMVWVGMFTEWTFGRR
jgi:hypothetical protein